MSINLKKFENRIIGTYSIANRPAIYKDFPELLNPELIRYLNSKDIKSLYSHQAEMFDKAQTDENIIITTSTASGKTLSFLLPVLNKILENPASRAIFVYPTKALTSDQFRNILPIIEYFGSDKINAGVYDGDTPPLERTRIRKEANIILTNPEMLNAAFLPWHNKNDFNFIFQNLDFIVIDELHYYRGAFGSHIANIIRRLKRVCKFYGSKPQFFCSTATIANPIELAENIFGETFNIVERDGSPRGEKEIFFWVPPIKKNSMFRIEKEIEASDLIPEMLIQDFKLIAFSQSRRELEVILKEVKENLDSDSNPIYKTKNFSNLISGYRGGYKAAERKEIERQLTTGDLRGVIATNALELGIDIGDIDLVISIGFPKTKASFFQQIGRAGRKGKKSYAIVLLDLNRTYDNYIAMNPEWIFDSKVENAIIDKDNLFIQIGHIRAAAAELPISLDEIKLFPNLGEILPILIRNKELIKSNGKFIWNGKDYPAGDYSLRTITEIRYKVINKVNKEMLTEMEEVTAYREVHPNAIYIHDGEMYLVETLDMDNKIAEVIPVDYNYYTTPWVHTRINIINSLKDNKSENTEKHFGDLKVATNISMFKKVQFHNHHNLGSENIDLPLEKVIETEGLWLVIPKIVTDYFNKYTEKYQEITNLYYQSIANVCLNAFMIRTMTSDNDVGNGVFVDINSENQMTYNIAIYDNYIGGLGFAEKGYDLVESILFEAFEIVSNCSCKSGCPACVGNSHIDKKVISWAIKSFSMNEPAPEKFEEDYIEEIENTEEKLFAIENVEVNWGEFKKLINENCSGVYMSDFLQSFDSAKFNNNKLALITQNYIDKDLISNENIVGIKGLINKYFRLEEEFEILFNVQEKSNNLDKIERRYLDLIK